MKGTIQFHYDKYGELVVECSFEWASTEFRYYVSEFEINKELCNAMRGVMGDAIAYAKDQIEQDKVKYP